MCCFKKTILGRENKCCCFGTGFGKHLIGATNIFLWLCTLINFIRVIKVAWNPLTWVALALTTLRVLFYFRLCCDSIPARN